MGGMDPRMPGKRDRPRGSGCRQAGLLGALAGFFGERTSGICSWAAAVWDRCMEAGSGAGVGNGVAEAKAMWGWCWVPSLGDSSREACLEVWKLGAGV